MTDWCVLFLGERNQGYPDVVVLLFQLQSLDDNTNHPRKSGLQVMLDLVEQSQESSESSPLLFCVPGPSAPGLSTVTLVRSPRLASKQLFTLTSAYLTCR